MTHVCAPGSCTLIQQCMPTVQVMLSKTTCTDKKIEKSMPLGIIARASVCRGSQDTHNQLNLFAQSQHFQFVFYADVRKIQS